MQSSPKLFRVLLEVANLDQASSFYNALLGVEGRRVGGGRCYYDCGEVIVGLVDVGEWPEAGGQPAGFVFCCERCGRNSFPGKIPRMLVQRAGSRRKCGRRHYAALG